MGVWAHITARLRRPPRDDTFERAVEEATAYCVAHLDEARAQEGEWRLIRHLQRRYGFSEERCCSVIQDATERRDIAALAGRDDTAPYRALARANGHTLPDTPTLGSHTIEWECTRDGCSATVVARRGSGGFVHATVDHGHPYRLSGDDEGNEEGREPARPTGTTM